MTGRFASAAWAFSTAMMLATGCLLAMAGPASAEEGPNGGVIYGGHEYLLVASEASWQDAHDDCDRRGGHLVTVTSQGENDFVRALEAEHELWLGLTDEAAEGSFAWVTGEALAYTNWNDGEPNDGFPGEDRALMYLSGKWNDAPDEWYGFPVVKFYVVEWDEVAESAGNPILACCGIGAVPVLMAVAAWTALAGRRLDG